MSNIVNKSMFRLIPFQYISSILIAIIILILLNYTKIREYLETKNERDKHREIVLSLDDNIKKKQTEKEEILTNKFENEKLARDTYNMKKEDESVLIISEDDTSPTKKLK